MFTITINKSKLDKLNKNAKQLEINYNKFVLEGFNNLELVIRDRLRANMPIITGRGRRSVKSISEGRLKSKIGHDKNETKTEDGKHSYMDIVYYGITKGYYIYPKDKQALRFEIGGKEIFARRVFIPPRPGNKFIDRTVDQLVSGRVGEKVMGLSLKLGLGL